MISDTVSLHVCQGRHLILICGGGGPGAVPPAGVQGAEPLGGGQGAKPQRFWHFKGVPDMNFCGYYDEIPKTIVLCFKLNVSIRLLFALLLSCRCLFII